MKFDVDKLACLLDETCPQIRLAFLHGSARYGEVSEGSDIDVALLVEDKPTLELYQTVTDVVERAAPTATCDIGILNKAEPVYRFEALKGRLLFWRDEQEYQSFFSLTCREYESQMASYQRQRRYRMQRTENR